MNEIVVVGIVLMVLIQWWYERRKDKRMEKEIFDRASKVCADHITEHPAMHNIPIQSVYELLVDVQREVTGLKPVDWKTFNEKRMDQLCD